MSEDKVPDWIRAKREIQSLLNGMWDSIGQLWDRQHDLERRVKRLEDETRPKERWHRH